MQNVVIAAIQMLSSAKGVFISHLYVYSFNGGRSKGQKGAKDPPNILKIIYFTILCNYIYK